MTDNVATSSHAFEHFGAAALGARDNQEDFRVAVSLDGGHELLLVVADGMGGHDGGEIASEVAATAFVDCFVNNTIGDPWRRLKIALAMANEALTDHIRREPELDGMGTTLIAAHLGPEGLVWISVGDSLLLHLRGDAICRLNADHSMAPGIERRFLAGQLTRHEADTHPERNELLSVLTGWHSPDMVDCPNEVLALERGDRIIVASDGLQTIELTEVAVAGMSGNAQESVQRLFQGIADKASRFQDNTVIELAIVR